MRLRPDDPAPLNGLGCALTRLGREREAVAVFRRIVCRYEVPVEIFPGLVHTFRFHIETEKPYLVEPDPEFL